MKRTKKLTQVDQLPDAINASPQGSFTMIPNRVLKTPELSAKAKIILFILLSNRHGWCSYRKVITGMMKEGDTAVDSGINELKDAGYLCILKYRCKKSKEWIGSFWAYTTIQNQFDLREHYQLLDAKGLELVDIHPLGGNPDMENPLVENPLVENPGLIIYNDNKTKNNKIKKYTKKLNYYFDTSQFNQAWNDWVEYKKAQFNHTYSAQAEQAALTKLHNLSGKDEKTAIEMIQTAMARLWKGFWTIKNEDRKVGIGYKSKNDLSEMFKSDDII